MTALDGILPVLPAAGQVDLVYSGDAPDELWVIPDAELGLVDLPSLRHLLPADFISAPVVGFCPIADSLSGGWVLKKGA